jgi:hypothetical protein
MAGEQIPLPFPPDVEVLEEDPVPAEMYVHIVRSKTVGAVCRAFRGERVPALSEQLPAVERKRA